MPEMRGAFGVGVIDNKIYCVGGGYSNMANSFGDLLIYDIESDSWSYGEPLPEPRVNNPCVVYNEKLYCFGGRTASTVTKDLFIYDPVLDKWDTGTNMPEAKFTQGAALVQDNVYVMGGGNSAAQVGSLKTMHVYNITNDSWSSGPDMPHAVNHLATVTLHNRIYTFSPTATQVYDLIGGSWSVKTKIPLSGTFISNAVLYKKYAVIVGDERPGTGYSEVWIYDTETDTWSEGVPLPTAQRATSVIVGNKIYAIGSYYVNQNKLEIFTIDDHSANGETPGNASGKCCCCGKFRLEVEIPISNNLEVLPEIQKLAQIIKGCDNSSCCKS